MAVDTTKVDAIASGYKALADALLADPTELALIPRKVFYTLPSYSEQTSSMSLTDASVRDTKQLLDSLKDSPMESLVQAANDALSDAILASSLGERRINLQNGIHVRMPSFGHPLSDEAALYDQESWAKDTNWGSLIKAIDAANPKQDPDFTLTLINGDNPTEQDPPTLDITINDDDSRFGELRIAEKLSDTKYKRYGSGGVNTLTPGPLSVAWTGNLGALDNNGTPVPVTAIPGRS